MKIEINNEKLVEILKKRGEITEKGYPIFDNIEKIVTKVIKNNMSRIAADNEAWIFIKPYVPEEEYTAANKELKEEYRQLQKLEYESKRLRDKTLVVMEKEKVELKEFEEISTIKLEEGKAMAETIDMVEEYKKKLRERNQD